MKINGKQFSNDNAIFGPVVIKRGDDEFAFFAQPVWNYIEFDAICPRPTAPVTGWNPSSGKKEADPKSPVYKEAMQKYGRQRWGYHILKSLEPSKLDLSEHGVNIDDPDSLVNVEEALQYNKEKNPNGLGEYEFLEVMRLVDEANCLDAEKLEENKQSFLDRRAALASNSASGKPATDGK